MTNRHSDKSPSFASMSDEAVVAYVQETGNQQGSSYLFKKYRNMIHAKAREFFLVGGDEEDLIQEASLGFFKAIRDYDDSHNKKFSAFATQCVKYQLITAIKAASRRKHQPLNSYVSLYKPVSEQTMERTMIEMVSQDKVASPEEMFIVREEFEAIEMYLQEVLSPLEWTVFRYYLQGHCYHDMAQAMGRSEKSIDNALQRVKKKLQNYMLYR